MAQRNVAVIVGSLRKGSFSRNAAKALIKLAPDSLSCALVEIGDLSLYRTEHSRLMRRPAFMSNLMLMLDGRRWLQRLTMRGMAFEPRIFDLLLAAHVGAVAVSAVRASHGEEHNRLSVRVPDRTGLRVAGGD